MNTRIAPIWALTALAIDGAADPTIRKGIHFKVLPNGLLGIPVSPFLVYRTNTEQIEKRSEIRWFDSKGNELTTPFDISQENPVTGWLPSTSEANCCWVEVLVGSSSNQNSSANSDPILRIDGLVSTPRGFSVIATRAEAPYRLAATGIQQILVSGKGKINGVTWLDANLFLKKLSLKEEPWRIMALPVVSGARYAGIRDAEAEADNRVSRGAPKRFGLHDFPDASSPSAVGRASPDDELYRIGGLKSDIMENLSKLLNDISLPPSELTTENDLMDGSQKVIGKININCLGAVLTSTIDPGVGRWLGFADMDGSSPSIGGDNVVVYVIGGIWKVNLKSSRLLKRLRQFSVDKTSISIRYRGEEIRLTSLSEDGDYILLWTVACATLGVPNSKPSPPILQVSNDGKWVPVNPPEAKREIIVTASGLGLGASVAFAKEESQNNFIGLNPLSVAGRRLTLIPGTPKNATSSGTGEFFDRNAKPGIIRYRMAQADCFGRWSDWTEVNAPAKERPLPPRPIVNVHYEPSVIPEPLHNRPLSGSIQLELEVPPTECLSPGSNLLKAVEITVDGESNPRINNLDGSEQFIVTITGPPLGRATRRDFKMTCKWIDSAGRKSLPSATIVLQLFDPRPPESVTLSNNLIYSSSPDIKGKSTIELKWRISSPTQKRFRIFYSDETRLKAKLQNITPNSDERRRRAQSVMRSLQAARDRVELAGIFTGNSDLFGRDAFEQITADPIESASQEEIKFVHSLPGSLKVMSFYRVITISESNVESSFGTSPIVPVSVPNTDPPLQPLLAVQPQQNGNIYSARVKLQIPRGVTKAVQYRLRRTAYNTTDINLIPIVSVGQVGIPPSDIMQEIEIIDNGGLQIEPNYRFEPWITYSWIAEVRGASEIGGGPAGQWSNPSMSVSTSFIPSRPPRVPSNLTLIRTDAAVRINWQHPESHTGGTLGSYTVDIYRTPPLKPSELLVSHNLGSRHLPERFTVDNQGRFAYIDNDSGNGIPNGTKYSLIITDPIGRKSERLEVSLS